MGVIKRSLLSITQRFGKSLILLLVIFLLGNVIAAAVTVKDATGNVEQSMKERLGAYVSVDMNEEYMMQGNPDPKEFTFSKTLADQLGESPYVREYTYSAQNSVEVKGMKKYESDNRSFQVAGVGGAMGNYFDFGLVANKGEEPNDVKNEKVSIVEGRFPKKEDETKNPYVITISEEVAELNDLKVGDKVELAIGVIDRGNPNEGFSQMNEMKILDEVVQEYEIIGIFKPKDVDTGNQMDEIINEFSKNNLYTSLTALEELDRKAADIQVKENGGSVDDYLTNISPTFILNSVDDLDAFVEEFSSLLPKGYKFNTSKDSFQSIASSITNMNNLSTNIYYFGIIVSIVILSLIIVIFLRERKAEFGIYQALGEPRIKTMFQIGFEMIFITVVAVSLAVFSGNAIAKTVSTQMIETQLLADEESQQNGMMGAAISIGGNDVEMPKITKEEVIESYQVKMDTEYIIQFYGVMVGASTVATLISMIYILRLKPREILL